MEDKFKFVTISKHVSPKPLCILTIDNNSQLLTSSDVSNDAKANEIEKYYTNIEKIRNSGVGSGASRSAKYDGPEIINIYTLLYGTKPKGSHKKAFLIDEILKYYENYKPIRHNAGSVVLIFNDKKDQPSDNDSDEDDDFFN